jgi:hypothetical protein
MDKEKDNEDCQRKCKKVNKPITYPPIYLPGRIIEKARKKSELKSVPFPRLYPIFLVELLFV